jgi:ribonuclease Z
MLFVSTCRRIRVSAYQFLFTRRQQQQQRGMKAYIQFVGQTSPEGPSTLVVHYDTQRYMFNCREGTQRLCVQEKVRLGKLSNIFLTRLSWDCVGGLPGMLLRTKKERKKERKK